jgi:hypothetical protein
MRTGMRCASRTYPTVGLAAASSSGPAGLSRSVMPRLMLSTWLRSGGAAAHEIDLDRFPGRHSRDQRQPQAPLEYIYHHFARRYAVTDKSRSTTKRLNIMAGDRAVVNS